MHQGSSIAFQKFTLKSTDTLKTTICETHCLCSKRDKKRKRTILTIAECPLVCFFFIELQIHRGPWKYFWELFMRKDLSSSLNIAYVGLFLWAKGTVRILEQCAHSRYLGQEQWMGLVCTSFKRWSSVRFALVSLMLGEAKYTEFRLKVGSGRPAENYWDFLFQRKQFKKLNE